jgi:hypothetical protein
MNQKVEFKLTYNRGFTEPPETDAYKCHSALLTSSFKHSAPLYHLHYILSTPIIYLYPNDHQPQPVAVAELDNIIRVMEEYVDCGRTGNPEKSDFVFHPDAIMYGYNTDGSLTKGSWSRSKTS